MDIPRTPKETAEWMRESEKQFSRELRKAAEALFSRSRRKILTIAGPTCSGKTTVAGRLSDLLTEAGYRTARFSLDDFFRERKTAKILTEPPPDCDSPEALDRDTLRDVFCAMQEGKAADIPVYDFVTGQRRGYRKHTPQPEEIQIWEGIQALYPSVRAILGTDTYGIFLDVRPPETLAVQGSELRLFRRILRDSRCRGASAAFTLHMWPDVRANEIKNIYSCTSENQFCMNTFLPYEPYVTAPYLLPLLKEIPADSPYRPEAERYCEYASLFLTVRPDPAWIPHNSILREFIGCDAAGAV